MRFTNQRQWVNRLRTIKANLAYQGSKYAKSSFLALPYKEPSYLILWKGKKIYQKVSIRKKKLPLCSVNFSQHQQQGMNFRLVTCIQHTRSEKFNTKISSFCWWANFCTAHETWFIFVILFTGTSIVAFTLSSISNGHMLLSFLPYQHLCIQFSSGFYWSPLFQSTSSCC
jgi:hypothetical protein